MAVKPTEKDRAWYLARETEMRRMFLQDEGRRGVRYWLDGMQALIEGRATFDRATVTLDEASQMMGDNFHSIEAVEHQLLGPSAHIFSPEQVRAMEAVLFPHTLIEACAKTHILQAVAPMNLLGVHTVCPDLFWASHRKSIWFAEEKYAFASTIPDVCWVLLRKRPVPESTFRTWRNQQELLEDGEVVPEASVVAQVMAAHYKETGERLFRNYHVRCADLAPGGQRINLGYFHSDGFHVRDYEDGSIMNLGLAGCRKFS